MTSLASGRANLAGAQWCIKKGENMTLIKKIIYASIALLLALLFMVSAVMESFGCAGV